MIELHQTMHACRLCLTTGHAIMPGAVFSGRPGAQVMLIGQAPGVTEVEARRPFNAGSGRRLFEWLGAAGWEEADFRANQYMTAVTKCYPGKNGSGRGDRVPSKAEQALCRPFLEAEIRLIAPRLMIPVGGLAIKLFYPDGAKLTDLIGTAAYFPAAALADPVNFDLTQAEILTAYDRTRPKNGRWLVPLPHPSGASLWPNRPANQQLINQAVQLLKQIRLDWGL
jgi:uracil-DNA glycosylase